MFPTVPASLPPDNSTATTGSIQVYIGTYTGEKSRGIYRFRLDLESGSVSPVKLAAETTNPSFLAAGPGGRFVYAVSEVSNFDGRPSGGVAAYAVSPEDGTLALLNRQPSGGRGPCFVSVSPDGRCVLTANYGSGSVACLPVGSDGSLQPPASTVQHSGSSVHPTRQKGPHAHSIYPDPTGRFALACDLGLDQVLVYRLDSTTGTLAPHAPPFARVSPGAGPRHLAFHPNGRFVYVANEMGNTVTAFTWDSAAGRLDALQTVTTLPDGFDAVSYVAEVRVHPSGQFLYVSNRGHDSLALFRIDPETGRLTSSGHTPTGGKTPRHFNIDPTGRWLIAANQDSDILTLFRIDPSTGALAARQTLAVGRPACVLFLPLLPVRE